MNHPSKIYKRLLRPSPAFGKGRAAGILPEAADRLCAPSPFTRPWFLSVSRSGSPIANKILQPVHLNGLGSFTDKQRRVWSLTKHRNTPRRQACIFCEWANKWEPPIWDRALYPPRNKTTSLTDGLQLYQEPFRKCGFVSEAGTWCRLSFFWNPGEILPCATLVCVVRSPQWAARLHFRLLCETVPSGPDLLLSTSWLGWLNFGVHRDSHSPSRHLPSILPQKSCPNWFLWTGWRIWGNYILSLGQISDARCLDRLGHGSTSPEHCVSWHGEDYPDVGNEGGWCCREKDGEFQAAERCPSDSVVSKHD